MRRLSVLLCVVLCAAVLSTACSAPPQKELTRAAEAIEAARAAGAEQYAAESFTAASTALRQAREAVDQRDYRLALSRAVDANDRAQDAAKEAADAKTAARTDSEAAVNTVNAELPQLEAHLKTAEAARVPKRELAPAREVVADAAAALQKARTLLQAGNYAEAKATVKGFDEQIRTQIRAVGDATLRRTAHRPARAR
jgi:hypothetical protein